uniref:Uncharacterized protein LOC123613334 n=1 Tax=Camelus bactrianus TaxID=9837 RepID=A0A9W3H911_CAMBA|nr:uncharacterized protein LOC123613334 [Camelus bactrianus]
MSARSLGQRRPRGERLEVTAWAADAFIPRAVPGPCAFSTLGGTGPTAPAALPRELAALRSCSPDPPLPPPSSQPFLSRTRLLPEGPGEEERERSKEKGRLGEHCKAKHQKLSTLDSLLLLHGQSPSQPSYRKTVSNSKAVVPENGLCQPCPNEWTTSGRPGREAGRRHRGLSWGAANGQSLNTPSSGLPLSRPVSLRVLLRPAGGNFVSESEQHGAAEREPEFNIT